MPQFDKITFFNQIFWLFIFFSGFYLIFLKIFLPKLSSILKARAKKLQKGSDGVVAFSKEQDVVTKLFNSSIEEIASLVKVSVSAESEKTCLWVNTSVAVLNEEKLTRSNHAMEKILHYQFMSESVYNIA